MSERHTVLRDLVELAKPIDELRESLAAFEWDFKDIPLTLNENHFCNVIERYIKGELLAQNVEDWANLIESREDIALRSSKAEELREILHELANPVLTQELTQHRAMELMKQLNVAKN